MRALGVVLIVACGGCDVLFHIDKVGVAADGGHDSPGIPDAPPVLTDACDGHDEDGDTVPDCHDNCPTVANLTQPDGDMDGVGDDCDPDPSGAGDKLLLFSSMQTLAGFTVAGNVTGVANESQLFSGSSSITSVAAFSRVTAIDVTLSYGGAPAANDLIVVTSGSGDQLCGIELDCLTSSNPCEYIRQSSTTARGEAMWSGHTASQLVEIRALTNKCELRAVTSNSFDYLGSFPLENGMIGVSVTGMTEAPTIHSIVVYGN